ncbi:MAG: peptidase, partial [Treponema sp.]|nr:peptidase [Treponema sp.]
MIVRNKNGEFRADNSVMLLDFLGVKKEAAGPQAVKAGVELIASVPFRLAAEGEAAGLAWTLSTFDLDRFGERIDPAG